MMMGDGTGSVSYPFKDHGVSNRSTECLRSATGVS
jgi:hypothetical protein